MEFLKKLGLIGGVSAASCIHPTTPENISKLEDIPTSMHPINSYDMLAQITEETQKKCGNFKASLAIIDNNPIAKIYHEVPNKETIDCISKVASITGRIYDQICIPSVIKVNEEDQSDLLIECKEHWGNNETSIMKNRNLNY